MRRILGETSASSFLEAHFRPIPASELVTTIRTFPATSRVDLQKAVDNIFSGAWRGCRQLGLHTSYQCETLTFNHLLGSGPFKILN